MKKLLLTPILFLAACATPEQLAEQRAQQARDDDLTCQSYGLRPHTDAFANCRLQLDLARSRPVYYGDPYYDSPHIHAGFGYYHYR